MTTQPPSRALVREAAGLLLTTLGVLGVLAALSTIHWAAGLSATMGGIFAAGLLATPKADAPPAVHALRVGACLTGYGGLTACAFILSAPLGWIGVALAVAALGWWLSTGETADETAEGA
ncbi:hypothetical protein [Streptomyces griseus]|uniref:hypothetical protein n=1 Tax=Streptomyces griseus TaxID=1911 RepID=UPI00379ADA34